MVQLQQSDVRNGLLRALSADDFAFVRDQLTLIDLKLHERMIMANKPITRCISPRAASFRAFGITPWKSA